MLEAAVPTHLINVLIEIDKKKMKIKKNFNT